MSIYAWIWIALAAIGLLVAANKHGKPKQGKEDFWVALTGIGISASLLYFGGFFNGGSL